jgi:hypothetical protein
LACLRTLAAEVNSPWDIRVCDLANVRFDKPSKPLSAGWLHATLPGTIHPH